MIDTTNHGRASEALLIYKTATRRFIARTLKNQNGGAGDWFANLVLPHLSRPIAERLKDQVDGAIEGGGMTSRGGREDEGPERFLEEKHFPRIVNGNWNTFRHSLKDRDAALSQFRQIRTFRNEKVAHNDQPVTDEEVIEIIETCGSAVAPFDSTAAQQLAKLLIPTSEREAAESPQPSSPSESDSNPTEQEGAESLSDSESWERVGRSYHEQVREWEDAMERRIARFLESADAAEALNHIADHVEEFALDIEIDQDSIDQARADLMILRWDELAPELVALATKEIGTANQHWNQNGYTESGFTSGTIEFDYETPSGQVSIQIHVDVQRKA